MSENWYGPYDPEETPPPGAPPRLPHPPRQQRHPHPPPRSGQYPPGARPGPYPPGPRYPYPPGQRMPAPPTWRAPYQMPPPPPPAYPLMPPPEPQESQGFGWALTPLLTFGLATPFTFWYAAAKKRSVSYGVTATGYTGALLTAFVFMNLAGGAAGVLGSFLMMMLWIAGTVHAFAIRPSVFPRTAPPNRMNQHAVQVAKYRRTLREEARTLATEDPALAHELRIGRPDLPRAYDDGGLIDVNNASPQALLTIPGMNEALVATLLERRKAQGGFYSAAELALDIDYPADGIAKLTEYTVFLP